MKKTKKVVVDMFVCDICGKEITNVPRFHEDRLKILHRLVPMHKFDAHEACVNKVIKAALVKFIR